MYGMKRTTIYLPEELKARLEVEALRRNISEAEFIRQAVDKELTRMRMGAGIITGPLPEGISAGNLRDQMEGFGEL
jgi:predicted transcriptional regulator